MNNTMNKTVAALTASAALVVSLGACSSGNTIAPPPAAAPAATETATPTATPTPQQDVAAFGGSVTFTDGLKVTVSQPKAVPASQSAYGAVEGKIVVLDLTVTNGSKASVNATMLGYPKFSYGADNVQAKNVADVAQNIGNGSLTTILPGETQTVHLGFGVPAAGYSAVRVEVRPLSYTEQPAVFKGSVG